MEVTMREQPDVPYGTGNRRELKLDVYSPAAANNQRTAVLMFHGGGWRRGDRKMLVDRARLLAMEGFTAMAVEYRLLDESPWPAAIHDVKAAIRWARANAAQLEIEPERIALCSFSAGAHLSLIAAGTVGDPWFEGEGGNPGVDTSVGALAVFYPPALFHAGENRERGSLPVTALLGDGATADEARTASPLTYMTAGYPPTFFLHGGADRVVSPSASVVLYDALRAAGVEADLHVFAGQHHGFDHVDVFREVCAKELALFFRRTVSEKDAMAKRIFDQNTFVQRAAAEAAAGGSR
jgi:acetyl esterase/lipase